MGAGSVTDTTGQDLAELSAGALLDLAERGVVRRREAEVEDLRVVLAWADVHSTDPRHDAAALDCQAPRAVRADRGGVRPV